MGHVFKSWPDSQWVGSITNRSSRSQCDFCDRFRVGEVGWGGGQSFRSWASVRTVWAVRRSLPLGPSPAPPPPPPLRWDVLHVLIETLRERGLVSRRVCFSVIIIICSHYCFTTTPVGRRRSLGFGTLSLQTVGKSLNKKLLFYNR